MQRPNSRQLRLTPLASSSGRFTCRPPLTDSAQSSCGDARRGFTIVELLIVVVVIAILAAITIVAYNGINSRARTSAASSAAQQAAKKVMTYAITNTDTYPTSLSDAGIDDSGSTSYQYRVDNSSTPKTFCLTATSSNISYFVSNSTTSPAAGACAGHGANGAATVTNLITNPSAESNTSPYSASGVTVLSSPDWSAAGSRSLRQTPTSTTVNDSFSAIDGAAGAVRMGLEAGKTYTLSATLRLSAPQTGSLDPRARSIQVFTKVAPAGYVTTQSAQAPNVAGSQRLSVTFTVPVGVTEAFARLYNGALQGAGDTYWDAVMLTEDSIQQTYADGNTAGWAWNGAVNNSISTGPAI